MTTQEQEHENSSEWIPFLQKETLEEHKYKDLKEPAKTTRTWFIHRTVYDRLVALGFDPAVVQGISTLAKEN